MIKDSVGTSLDILVLVPFGWVLVLLVGLTLPAVVGDAESMQDILDFGTNLNVPGCNEIYAWSVHLGGKYCHPACY